MLFGIRAIAAVGGEHAVAFSLNLNPGVAERASRKLDWLRRAIVRRVGGSKVPLILAYGAKGGRLHVHGAFAAASAEHCKSIRMGLRAVAGEWANPHGHVFQLRCKRLGEGGPPDGWACYFPRNIAEARRVAAGGHHWSMTNTARRVAKQLHVDLRQRINSVERDERRHCSASRKLSAATSISVIAAKPALNQIESAKRPSRSPFQ